MSKKNSANNQSPGGSQPLPEPNALWKWLLPELKTFRPIEQGKVLATAKDGPLKSMELIVIAIWLVTVTLLTKVILTKGNMASDVAATLVVNLLVTAPLLLAVFVPLHVRRLRRGIREQILDRDKK